MDRSGFLKTFTVLAAGTLLSQRPALAALRAQPRAPLAPEPGEPRYRGTSDGLVLVTTDNGGSWQVHANFGSEFAVLNVYQAGTDTVAYMRGRGVEFQLGLSADGRNWVTR